MEFANVLARIFTWLATATPAVKLVMTVMTVGIMFSTYLSVIWGTLFTKVDTLIVSALPTTFDFSPLGMINYVFPVDTALSYLSAFCVLKLVCAAIRIIKSFVPTVA